LTLLVGSLKPVPDMTCNVFGGTLNLAQSVNLSKLKSCHNCVKLFCAFKRTNGLTQILLELSFYVLILCHPSFMLLPYVNVAWWCVWSHLCVSPSLCLSVCL